MLMSGLAQFYDISCQRDVGRIVAAEFLLFGTNREIYYSATNWMKTAVCEVLVCPFLSLALFQHVIYSHG